MDNSTLKYILVHILKPLKDTTEYMMAVEVKTQEQKLIYLKYLKQINDNLLILVQRVINHCSDQLTSLINDKVILDYLVFCLEY